MGTKARDIYYYFLTDSLIFIITIIRHRSRTLFVLIVLYISLGVLVVVISDKQQRPYGPARANQ